MNYFPIPIEQFSPGSVWIPKVWASLQSACLLVSTTLYQGTCWLSMKISVDDSRYCTSTCILIWDTNHMTDAACVMVPNTTFTHPACGMICDVSLHSHTQPVIWYVMYHYIHTPSLWYGMWYICTWNVVLYSCTEVLLKLLGHLVILFDGLPKPEACWSSRYKNCEGLQLEAHHNLSVNQGPQDLQTQHFLPLRHPAFPLGEPVNAVDCLSNKI